MLRRGRVLALFIPGKFRQEFTSKHQWSPEIRMLDKDERLPDVSLEAKLRDALQFAPDPTINWPPMDPLNPTWEQRRSQNTNVGAHQFTDYYVHSGITGFRTVPVELIDWRSTMYGDALEELPYANEKLAYQAPDYTLAGLVYTGEEHLKMMDNVPKTADQSSFGVLLSPKIDAWMKYCASKWDRGVRWSFARLLSGFLVFFIGYKMNQYSMRHHEQLRRVHRTWWDGANAGTWKYGGNRAQYWGSGISGGHMIPILEW